MNYFYVMLWLWLYALHFLMFCLNTNGAADVWVHKWSLPITQQTSVAFSNNKAFFFAAQRALPCTLQQKGSDFLSSIEAQCAPLRMRTECFFKQWIVPARCFSTIFINIMKCRHWCFNTTPWVRPVLPEIALPSSTTEWTADIMLALLTEMNLLLSCASIFSSDMQALFCW